MMKKSTSNPNHDLYAQLQRASNHFNQKLFDKSLPEPVLTLQRAQGAAGYFSPKRWEQIDGEQRSEIALNPTYLANSSLLQLFQTIVHEQCHLWQHVHGKPARPGYHNVEWAGKMMDIGLIPSSTGSPGGKKTGQKMSDYPAAKGPFIEACVELLDAGFILPLIDRGFDEGITMRSDVITKLRLNKKLETKLCIPIRKYFGNIQSELDHDSAMKKRKIKYSCRRCMTNVWGKPALEIHCGSCGTKFDPVT